MTTEVIFNRDNTQLVCKVVKDSGVMGYLVIDSTVGGFACGGLRMMPDIDEAEVRGLARAMTLKYGFLGLPMGGAKAGVIGNPEAPQPERLQCLEAFGKAIAPVLQSRLYLPATDMGTNDADIRCILQAAGVGIKRRDLPDTQSAYHTAVSVFAGAKQAMSHLSQTLAGSSVAIEGFGNVGSALGELLSAANARVVAISTWKGAIYNPQGLDVKKLSELTSKAGSGVVDLYENADRIDSAMLLELPVDMLCPCAHHNSLHADNAARVKARVVCPGANNPITPEAERILFERRVLCLPDFVANCGGVLGSAMAFMSVRQEKIAALIDRQIGTQMARVIDEAARQHASPQEIAVKRALRRFEQTQRNSAQPGPLIWLSRVWLELYRRGWVPGYLARAGMLSFLEKSMSSASW